MRTIQHFEIETHVNRLLDAVEKGETVVITRQGRPIARLVPEIAAGAAATEDAIAAVREFRKKMPRLESGEIRSSLHDGHRY